MDRNPYHHVIARLKKRSTGVFIFLEPFLEHIVFISFITKATILVAIGFAKKISNHEN